MADLPNRENPSGKIVKKGKKDGRKDPIDQEGMNKRIYKGKDLPI